MPTGEIGADTIEGRLIKFADRIAYINHDIDDAVRAGVLKNEDIPAELRGILGDTHRKRIDVMVRSLIRKTAENLQNEVYCMDMEPEILQATMALREFLFENVYFNPVAKS